MNQKKQTRSRKLHPWYCWFATLVALLKSVTQSKALTAMVLVGILSVITFFYFLLNSSSV